MGCRDDRPSDEMIKACRSYLSRAGLRERARIEKGYALEVIRGLAKHSISSSLMREKEYRGYLDLGLPSCVLVASFFATIFLGWSGCRRD